MTYGGGQGKNAAVLEPSGLSHYCAQPGRREATALAWPAGHWTMALVAGCTQHCPGPEVAPGLQLPVPTCSYLSSSIIAVAPGAAALCWQVLLPGTHPQVPGPGPASWHLLWGHNSAAPLGRGTADTGAFCSAHGGGSAPKNPRALQQAPLPPSCLSPVAQALPGCMAQASSEQAGARCPRVPLMGPVDQAHKPSNAAALHTTELYLHSSLGVPQALLKTLKARPAKPHPTPPCEKK